MALHQAYACQQGATVLAGLTNLDTALNSEVRADVGVGSPFPQFAYVAGVKPRVQFQSRAVKSVLTVTGSTGSAISGASAFKAYYAKLADGVPAAGNVHQIYTFDRGLLVPRRLQCSHTQDAMLDVEAVTYSPDGVTEPLIQSTGALPTIARDNIRHTLKSASVGAVDLGCITDLSIDFGIQVDTIGCKSDPYDKHIEKGGGVTATITITTLDADAIADAKIPVKGKGTTHANTSIVLRQRAADGILFAPDQDITFTAHGIAVVQTHSGQGQSRSQATIQLTCAWDGTNAPIIIGMS